MKFSAVFVFLASLCLALVCGQPVEHKLQQGLSLLVKEESEPSVGQSEYYLEEPEEVEGLRMRRATCDLLSVSTPFGSVNHAACAAHCLAMRRGYKGGRCRDGVCHCRK